jgi:hypothetical protein
MRALACLAFAAISGTLQSPESMVETRVARLGQYLVDYEAALGAIVASESYRQSEMRLRTQSATASASSDVIIRTRTLESEVAFLRLPGEREWFGVRHVLRVDRRTVSTRGALLDVLKSPATSIEQAVRAIVKASSEHNIGAVRTINMPTIPLEVLHPRHHQRLIFTLGRRENISGVNTRELRYRENASGGLIRDQQSRQMVSRGSVFVDDAGRVWRVTIELEHAHQAVMEGRTGRNELRVDFSSDARLGLLVPREMREEFELSGGGNFKGRATYSDFRRFTTTAKIIPQP